MSDNQLLRDSVYDAAWEQIERNGLFDRECASAILDMPEMRGLREALRALDQYGGPNYLEYLQVPEAVLDWIRAEMPCASPEVGP